MPAILVLDDETATRDGLAEMLRRLFPLARVIATGADAGLEAIEREDASIVLAGLSVAERIFRHGRSAAVRVVALTHEMGPDTLMKAEAFGVFASLRAPVNAGQLQTMLGPMLVTEEG